MVWMCVGSGVNGPAVLALVVLPLGRPGLRLRVWVEAVDRAVLARAAACSWGVRSTRSTSSGNERRWVVLMNDKAQNATAGTGLPYMLAKKRASPCACLPALVMPVSSPA